MKTENAYEGCKQKLARSKLKICLQKKLSQPVLFYRGHFSPFDLKNMEVLDLLSNFDYFASKNQNFCKVASFCNPVRTWFKMIVLFRKVIFQNPFLKTRIKKESSHNFRTKTRIDTVIH